MQPKRTFDDKFSEAPRDALVNFSVVCEPQSGASVEKMRRDLSLETVREYFPDPDVRARVVLELRRRGFEVFDTQGPVVTARGSVRLFESVFGGKLVMRTRSRETPTRRRSVTSIVLSRDSEQPSPREIPGAALITVAEEPEPLTPRLPPVVNEVSLHMPGEIAQLMGASATHRLSTPLGQRATGAGITVAVIDTGFGHHPYYEDHGYRIHRLAAPDISNPEIDEDHHGTGILAGLLACAPDVEALAIKCGGNIVNALNTAGSYAGVRIVSLSLGVSLNERQQFPSGFDPIPLQQSILALISNGITVIASAGNGKITFPAMMPEVLAVGGVDIRPDEAFEAWQDSSSFVSVTFKNRAVPDLCGLAARALVPLPGFPADPGPPPVPPTPPGWVSMPGGTSLAAPQVAGIAALLVQKNPALTPQGVRNALISTSIDVKLGRTAFGDKATKGTDLATGAGLANALKAWNSI